MAAIAGFHAHRRGAFRNPVGSEWRRFQAGASPMASRVIGVQDASRHAPDAIGGLHAPIQCNATCETGGDQKMNNFTHAYLLRFKAGTAKVFG